jgi:NTE family protein
MVINTLCLSGGGINGISFIGALEHLEKCKYININEINNYIGTSIGSIFCLFFILGYTLQEIKKFIMNFDFSPLNNYNNNNLDNILTNYGINNGDVFLIIIINFIKSKINIENINFIDLYKLTNKKLNIIGTNFTKSCEECFNYETSPLMNVIIAIRISISIPIFFAPVYYNNNYYIDGGVYNNFGLNYSNINNTIGIYIKFNINNNINSVIDIFIGTINIIFNSLNEKNINNMSNIIQIIHEPLDCITYTLSQEDKNKFLLLGINSSKKYLKNIYINNIKKILFNLIIKIFNKKKVLITNKKHNKSTQT